MIRAPRFHYDLPASRSLRFGAWSGAALVHGVAALALLVAWPQARDLLAEAAPIQVRMLDEARPPEPVKPPPLPPVKRLALPQATLPQPVATPQVATPPAPAVVATAAVAASPMVAAPVVVAETRPAPPAPVPEPLIEARFDADYLSNPKPPYPMQSRRLGEEGVVRLRVHVGPDGQALKVEIKVGSGYPRLDQSALDTVARWNFIPARRGATPVASWVVVPIVFSLS